MSHVLSVPSPGFCHAETCNICQSLTLTTANTFLTTAHNTFQVNSWFSQGQIGPQTPYKLKHFLFHSPSFTSYIYQNIITTTLYIFFLTINNTIHIKMIKGDDLYNVMCAMVPLYFAMLVAYGSVKWCKMFSPDQCSGINRFVAVFAVPVLSFHFISMNNPYQMDTKFIIADTLSKLMVLLLLSLWAIFFTKGSLEWLITLFSVATLPNTLVMGIPLLQAMYGDFTQSLMVQLVVLQCIIW